ncbi:RagB/SusD family nutrient uptake outer membrane protein [Proteiniphilum sp. X52]|uniref:RagB/SusD family nutrient uptake outer membrane protein n=1 Tax=Proteiniphilum sp. X52 TaxID=2382159 RepID=UPI000F0A4BE1|nr:RagB/SusD family nutrient uptake outer membrane protein [Proteiniphilum sp. X52]RNC66728.1 RagB/SusD family nutrient uptake outer membrane protein [Proteiniphilum sp. X52]
MKNIYSITFSTFSLLCILVLTGCSDEFLKEKTNYSNLSPEIYNDYTGAKLRVDDIYLRLLPSVNNDPSYRYPSTGRSDLHSQSTEEFSGLSNFVHPDVVITSSSNLIDWFHVNKATNAGPWGEIRNCNDVIEGISGSKLSDEQKEELLGQVYFFRAWQYYLLVKTYGGVPIIKTVQIADVSEAENLAVPRSTTKECIDFICGDLELAANMLPARWGNDDFARITKGAALALAGRARLLYASPLFNRTDHVDRWQEAYDANKAAIAALTEGNFGLAYKDAPGINASGWAKMLYEFNSDEAVFVTLYNKVHDDNAAHEIYRNNRREQSIRPVNANGGGGLTPTAMMVDLFPMADGKKPGESEIYLYDNLKFFMNRDPRFYRTFGFPGTYWRFEGDPTSLGTAFPYKGEEYQLWNYSWYAQDEKKNDITQSGYGADGLGLSYKSMYIRKRTNDFDMTSPEPVTLYRWSLEGNRQGSFGESAIPYMEIRYAEVLLNLAEAACGIGQGQEALEILREIRRRVGYTGDCGLDGSLAGDRGRLFGAILYERQIELAYEGKRFDDMRRWLLWDGGINMNQINGAPTTWTLSGFGGNTCTYLGVQPLNGKRRDNFELTAKTNASENQGSDPIASYRPAALDLKLDLSSQTDDLALFYETYLTRKIRQGDQEGRYVTFKPEYYLIGLTESAQKANVTLLQTIGWTDIRSGATYGTFDPLAE